MTTAPPHSWPSAPAWGKHPMREQRLARYDSSGMDSVDAPSIPPRRSPSGNLQLPLLIALLWTAEILLLLLDLWTSETLSLLAYFLLPALVAAVMAPPVQVAGLALGAVASGVISGWHFGTLLTVPYLVRLGAIALVGSLAVVLARVRERQTTATRRERDRVRATLDSLLDPHVVLRAMRDARGQITDFRFVDANEAACRYNRLPRAQLLGRRIMELFPAHAATGLLEMYRRVVETGRPLALDAFLYPHEILEEPRYFDIRAVAIGEELCYTWRDVTARQRTTEELADRARTDELTKLLNRRAAFDHLRDLHGRTPRTGQQLAVLFVDFDKFKAINDTHGHAAGDEVLRVTAERLRACLRHEDDLGARVGGDEMMIVLHRVHGLADASAVAEKLRALAAHPVRFQGAEITATVSIGVALARREESPENLVARADEAMYLAKQRGRNQVITINGNPAL